MTNRAISVVMAVYNGERFIGEQLDTILAELQPGDELVVIDDASTDRSMALVQTRQDHRIEVLRNASNLGVARSFERGLREARHEIVFLSDQDDRWLPGKRAQLLGCFERDPSCLLALSDAEVIDANSRRTARSFMQIRGGFKGGLLATLVRNRYLGCTMALDRRLLKTALPIPARAPMHDMWFGAMATLTGHVAYVDTPLIQYRRHDSNVTPGKRQSLGQMLVWRWQLLTAVLMRMTSRQLLRPFAARLGKEAQ